MLYAPTVLLIAWAVVITYFDVRYHRIPNALSLGAWVFGACLLISREASLLASPPQDALLAAAFGALVTLPAYAFKKLGAGDVKMLVAIGLLTSLPVTIACFVVAALLGVAIVMGWVMLDRWGVFLVRRDAPASDTFNAWLRIPLKERKMPYGALFSVGLAASLWLELRP